MYQYHKITQKLNLIHKRVKQLTNQRTQEKIINHKKNCVQNYIFLVNCNITIYFYKKSFCKSFNSFEKI